jgi:hypothetical protein
MPRSGIEPWQSRALYQDAMSCGKTYSLSLLRSRVVEHFAVQSELAVNHRLDFYSDSL